MKAFEFVAFNSSGEKKLGTVSASSLLEAKRKIKRRGFYLASIEIQGSSVGSGVSPIQSGIKRKRIQETSSHGQDSFSLFKGLKEFFFAKEKINV